MLASKSGMQSARNSFVSEFTCTFQATLSVDDTVLVLSDLAYGNRVEDTVHVDRFQQEFSFFFWLWIVDSVRVRLDLIQRNQFVGVFW